MQEYKLPKLFNWQTASNKLVKKYVADLYQTGTTAPAATELFNNTDVAFTYEYIAAGVYGISCSKPIFTGCGMGCPAGQRAQINVTNCFYYGILNSGVAQGFVAFPAANDYIMLLSTDSGSNSDNIIGSIIQSAIEVTIYP